MTGEDKNFLLALREYIERTEVTIDGEWGTARELQQIVSDGDMPAIYAEVLRRLAV